jgi:hypothetical protein
MSDTSSWSCDRWGRSVCVSLVGHWVPQKIRLKKFKNGFLHSGSRTLRPSYVADGLSPNREIAVLNDDYRPAFVLPQKDGEVQEMRQWCDELRGVGEGLGGSKDAV